ncbi:hypothetical protein [Streptomyces sp. S1]|uniref:hypothetical protein n=1 Tax=Streptomyces sp. S1 TaxID=718288 RepID=UPI003D718548
MYLVHVGLRAPAPRVSPHELTAPLVRSHVHPEDRAEHISVHPRALPHPVIGVYLRAASLAEAEAWAADLVDRVLARCPELSGWSPLRPEAPLLAPELILDQDAVEPSDSGPGHSPLDQNGQ